jgi:hypothetical protein
MSDRFEDNPFFLSILQNIEARIVVIYRQRPDLADFQVENALEALIRAYAGEAAGRPAKPPAGEAARQVYQSVREAIEWRLGRIALPAETGGSLQVGEPASVEDVLTCLKRIRRSVEFWTRENGPQGYLNYVIKFLA